MVRHAAFVIDPLKLNKSCPPLPLLSLSLPLSCVDDEQFHLMKSISEMLLYKGCMLLVTVFSDYKCMQNIFLQNQNCLL